MKNLITLFCLVVILYSCSSQKRELIPYYEKHKAGYKNIYGKTVIEPKFEQLGWGNLTDYMAAKKDGKWGVINRKGKFIIEPIYDDISFWVYNEIKLLRVKLNSRYGFINRKGKVIIPLIYEDTWGYDEELIKVKINNKWGAINKFGETIIPFEYDNFDYNWEEGLIGAEKNSKWGFIDKSNHVIIPFDYYDISHFSEGLANVAISYDKWGYIDHFNKIIIPFKYESFGGGDNANFHVGIAGVRQNKKSGYINKKGEIIIPLKYTYIDKFCKGYAYAEITAFDENNLQISMEGYVDSIGNELFFEAIDIDSFNWAITKAPPELPDYSHLLYASVYHPPTPYPSSDEDTSFNQLDFFYFDTTNLFDLDTLIDENYTDTLIEVYNEPFNDTTIYSSNTFDEYQDKWTYEKTWTLEKLLANALVSLCKEPQSYPDLCRLNQVCIACGMMIGVGNYGEEFMWQNDSGYVTFKKETLYKIIGTESLRQIAWNWISPYIKKAFGIMNPFIKKTYKEIAVYLKNHINNYDIRKVKLHLKNNERKFAYFNIDGQYDPNRKLSAFVDRLIIIHKVITVKDAKIWINKIADEVAMW